MNHREKDKSRRYCCGEEVDFEQMCDACYWKYCDEVSERWRTKKTKILGIC